MSYSQMFPAPPSSPRRASSSHNPSSSRRSSQPSSCTTSTTVLLTPTTLSSPLSKAASPWRSQSHSSTFSPAAFTPSSTSASLSLPKSVLQNNIGALQLFKGSSISLAMERFYASLTAAENSNKNVNVVDDGNRIINDADDDDIQSLSSRISKIASTSFLQSNNNSHSSINAKKIIHNADVQGLTWFHKKVLREVLSSNSPSSNHSSHTQHHNASSSRRLSMTMNLNKNSNMPLPPPILPLDRSKSAHRSKSMSHVLDHRNHSLRDHLRNGPMTSGGGGITSSSSTSSIDGKKEGDLFMFHHHFINEDVPLGLEYIHDPICLLETGTNTSTNTTITPFCNPVHHRNKKSHNCEMNVQIAAGINIALCIWSSNQYCYDDNETKHDEKKIYCKSRIRMKKANDAMHVLHSLLEYVKEQTEKGHKKHKSNDDDDDCSYGNYCYCCQQKKKKEAKELLQSQAFNSCSSMNKSWANILKEEDSDDDDGNDEKDVKTEVKPSCPDPKLLVIVHNNIGVLYFILNKAAQAKNHFEQAKILIESMKELEKASIATTAQYNLEPKKLYKNDNFQKRRSMSICDATTNNTPIRTQLLQSTKSRRSSSFSLPPPPPPPLVSSTSSFTPPFCNIPNNSNGKHQHHNLLPSMDYLHLTIMLNLTRVTIRLNGMVEDAKTLHKELNELIFVITNSDSTIQGVSSSKSLYQYQHQHHSSATTTASTTTATQRIKWLITVSNNYIPGLIQQRLEHHTQSLEHYNKMISCARKELGHDHIFVAMILEKRGNLLFDQRKCQNAMLSYLASLRIYEHQPSSPHFIKSEQQQDKNEKIPSCNGYQLDQSKLLYAIGRTLHDREEFADALGMYKKALSILKQFDNEDGKNKAIVLESIQIMCNIGRIYQITGELELSLEISLKIVDIASEMVGGSSNVLHPFVRNRLVVVGNIYVEMGKLSEAMGVFGRVARGSEEGTDWMVGHLRPEVEDVDTSAFAVRAAERLGEIGASSLSPHAAAA